MANFLIIYSQGGNMGGAQTLMARMANWLVEHGHEATALFLKPGIDEKVAKLFHPAVSQTTLTKRQITHSLYPISLYNETFDFCNADYVIPLSGDSITAASLFRFQRPPVVLPYVIYITQYCLPTALGRRLFRQWIPAPHKIFMSELIRDIHARALHENYEASITLPLPINCQPLRALERQPEPFNVISVGRIDSEMKKYNYSCVSVMRQLRAEGIPVQWTIYGGGAPEAIETLRALIKTEQAEEFVHFAGEIDYAHFPNKLATAKAFIGMGTAVIEAAAAGVPSIVAIAEQAKPVSQGFVYEMPVGSCGEVLPKIDASPIIDKLRDILLMSEAEYQALSKRHSDYVFRNYDIDVSMNQAIEQMNRFQAVPRNHSRFNRTLNLVEHKANRLVYLLKNAIKRVFAAVHFDYRKLLPYFSNT